ncbi:uncharacterized protein LOC116003956 [Ipomoea triloba]|uniref:uncharacterized protein LOC116003956 n=1 Tax=Ipomoea triloba TaxID=35885 RepID=UPI00125D3DC1|nr:uncharacterized protein LOC116003956 [Ipomoea triloba]
MGDFNDILHQTEKREGNAQPLNLINGFRDAVESSGLSDFSFEGYQFTWERSKDTPNWVEAKLDKILTSDSWNDLFMHAKASSVIAPKSDLLPLHLHMYQAINQKPKGRFRFENLWLKESLCRDVMIECWSNSYGYPLIDRVGRCGKAIWDWGKNFSRNFHRRIDYWKSRMEHTKHRRDLHGISLFREAQFQYLRVLRQQSDY